MSIKNSVLRKDEVSTERILNSLIDITAHYLVTNQQEKAQALYPTIKLLYQSLSKEQKAQLGKTCLELYKQLSQFKKK
jgi:hypothetical protein